MINEDLKALRDALDAQPLTTPNVTFVEKDRLARLLAAVETTRDALERIAALDAAEDSDEGHNEWGEADCFGQAQKMARAALAQFEEKTK